MSHSENRHGLFGTVGLEAILAAPVDMENIQKTSEGFIDSRWCRISTIKQYDLGKPSNL